MLQEALDFFDSRGAGALILAGTTLHGREMGIKGLFALLIRGSTRRTRILFFRVLSTVKVYDDSTLIAEEGVDEIDQRDADIGARNSSGSKLGPLPVDLVPHEPVDHKVAEPGGTEEIDVNLRVLVKI